MEKVIEGLVTGNIRHWSPTQFRQYQSHFAPGIQHVGFEVENVGKKINPKFPKSNVTWEKYKNHNPDAYETQFLLRDAQNIVSFNKQITKWFTLYQKLGELSFGGWHINISYKDPKDFRNAFNRINFMSLHDMHCKKLRRLENKIFTPSLKEEDFRTAMFLYLYIFNAKNINRKIESEEIDTLVENFHQFRHIDELSVDLTVTLSRWQSQQNDFYKLINPAPNPFESHIRRRLLTMPPFYGRCDEASSSSISF